MTISKENLERTNGHMDLSQAELRMLSSFAMHVQRKKSSKYLEIGIFGGGTIKFIKNCAKGIDCTGIDLFEDFRNNLENTHVSGNYSLEDVQNFLGQDVKLLKGDSVTLLKNMKEKYDLIFIDGNHTYEGAKADFENSLPLLAEDGFIAFHNCSAVYSPDYDLYCAKDGGPWLVCLELKLSSKMKLVGEAERLSVFARNKI